MKPRRRPLIFLILFCAYAGLVFLLFALGAFILSNGWGSIDSSPSRDFLYLDLFVLLPAASATGIVHLLGYLVSLKVAMISIGCGFLCGIGGVALLEYSISYSDDPVAEMGRIASVLVFCAFAAAGFVVASLVQLGVQALRKRHFHQGSKTTDTSNAS